MAPDDAWHKIRLKKMNLLFIHKKFMNFNIEKEIQKISQIKSEGISSYAGAHPCNQVACGMYVTLLER